MDKGVAVGDLKRTVEFRVQELLGDEVKLRFRPALFSCRPSFRNRFSSPMVRKMGKVSVIGGLRHGASESV